MRETPRPSWRAIERPPLTLLAGGATGAAGSDLAGAGGGTGAAAVGSSTATPYDSAMSAVARGVVDGRRLGHAFVIAWAGSAAGTGGSGGAFGIPAASVGRTQSITRRYGL